MQLGAINSVNFGAARRTAVPPVIDAEYEVLPEEASTALMLPEHLERFEKGVQDSQQNVHPLTALFGTGAFALAFFKGKDIIPFVRRAGVKVGEVASLGVAKAASTITGGVAKVFKKGNPLHYEAYTNKAGEAVNGMKDKISKVAATLRDDKVEVVLENGEKAMKVKEGEKFLPRIGAVVKDIFGEKNSQRVVDFLRKHEIVNGVRGADALTAAAAAWLTTDAVTDATENSLDKRDIKKLATEVIEMAAQNVA